MPREVIQTQTAQGLNQAYSLGTEMALLRRDRNGKFYAITPFAFCKDYFPDIYWARKTKKQVDVYGMKFRYNPIKHRFLSNQWQYFAVRERNFNMANHANAIREYLRHFDKLRGYRESKVIETGNDDAVIVQFDRRWTNYPALLSMFIQNIRIGVSYTGENIQAFLNKIQNKTVPIRNPQDRQRLAQYRQGIKDISNPEWKPKYTYRTYTDSYDIHNLSGFVTYYNNEGVY